MEGADDAAKCPTNLAEELIPISVNKELANRACRLTPTPGSENPYAITLLPANS
jgi:hypothetical protein